MHLRTHPFCTKQDTLGRYFCRGGC